MIKLEQIREGSIVVVRPGFGSESRRRVIVTEVSEDIKNGYPGISYTEPGDKEGEGHWAYLDQVDRIIQY